MVERGTVVGINGGDVDVMFKRTSACGKCCACGMMVGSDEMTIPLKNTIGATMGDKVIVEFSGKKSLKSSVIVYVFPLVFFVVGILLGYSFGNVVFPNILLEYAAMILGLVLMGVVFLIIRLLEPKFKREIDPTFKLVSIDNTEREEDDERSKNSRRKIR